MISSPRLSELATVLRRAAHPPLREWRFWIIQAMVVLIASAHLLVDGHVDARFPVDFPVALLIVPVGYAALQYGLTGSAATGVWATLLWLPDLLLPRGEGHTPTDLVALALVDGVAFFVGHRIEVERLAHSRAEQASAERLAAEVRYRQLFDTNRAPILVLDSQNLIAHANPAAHILFGNDVIGRSLGAALSNQAGLGDLSGSVLQLLDGRYYRLGLAALPGGVDQAASQVILEDVTEERREGQRATRYAQLVVQAEEDQRRRLSRELHDEPLQLFLHLARRLEILGGAPLVPESVRESLIEARRQALEAAARLRTLARDLRPPALDQLGLIAALSGFVADVEDEAGLAVQLEVKGDEGRLPPAIELGAFRIVQEAVRNTVSHAEASRVVVALQFSKRSLSLSVIDDGQGFKPGALGDLSLKQLGLVGMRERAHLLGGRLDVRSAAGAGTKVAATIPCPEASPAVTPSL